MGVFKLGINNPNDIYFNNEIHIRYRNLTYLDLNGT